MEIALGLESLACRCKRDQPIYLYRDDLNEPVVLLETFCIAFPGDEFKAIVPETVFWSKVVSGLYAIAITFRKICYVEAETFDWKVSSDF